MTTATLRKLEVTGSNGWQDWWSMKGGGMVLATRQPPHRSQFTIEKGTIARVQVMRRDYLGEQRWYVQWYLKHAYRGVDGPDDEAQGNFLTDAATIRAAFGLSDSCPDNQPDLARNFGAVCAVQGRFIRDGYRLNIPGPTYNGTSCGATNLSIFLTEEIMDEVERVLALPS